MSKKVGESRDKSGTSWLLPPPLDNFKRSGWPILNRPKIWNQSRRFGLPEPNNPDGRCTFKNPNLNFALRSDRCQFISPLVAHHHNSNFRHVRLRPPADILVLTGLGCFGNEKKLFDAVMCWFLTSRTRRSAILIVIGEQNPRNGGAFQDGGFWAE